MESSESGAIALRNDERTWAAMAHMSAFAGIFVPALGHIFGPLIVWIIKRDSSPFVDDQGKEALNAQISAALYGFIASLLFWTIILIPFVIIFCIVLYLADILFVILAAVAASNGKAYRYPCILRLIK